MVKTNKLRILTISIGLLY
jgi:hypothetical protein